MVCLDLLLVFTIEQMFKAGRSEKRKVSRGKAVEYDVMSMPTKEREQVIAHLGLSTPDTGAQANEKQDSSELINKLTTTLINMIEELEPDEARKALKLLSKGGCWR